jgi:transcriptional regulator with XRE-family HTH domain
MNYQLNQRKTRGNPEMLAKALRTILHFRGRTPTSVSQEARLSLSAVNDILNKRIKNPSLDTLQRIAQVLDVSVAQLIGEGDIVVAPEIKTIRVPIIGHAQGGVFVMPTTKRAKDLKPHIDIAVDSDLARGKYFALVVKGAAMDRAKDRPIVPGDIAICRDFNEAAQPLHDGRIYAIRRRLPDGSEETSLRRLVKRRGGFELHAESSDPNLAPQITAPADLDGDTQKDLFVLGRVVRTEQVRD